MGSNEFGSGGLEGGGDAFGGSSLDGFDAGEPEGDLVVGDDGLSLDLVGLEDGGLQNLDGLARSLVLAPHLLVQLRDGSVQRHVSEFFVHVDGAGVAKISEDDSVVLHS